jgi:circadian clock protein KaiC
MKKKIQLLPSGIPLIDYAWGGMYRGGTYFLIGSRKTGRTLLSLQFAMQSTKQNEVCLFFTNMRPKDLMIQAAAIDFDIEHQMNQNRIIVIRVAAPVNIDESEFPDEVLKEYFQDIVSVVEQYKPSKMVFDEVTPFIGFQSLEQLENSFLEMVEKIEDAGVTSMFVVADPATQPAKDVLNVMVNNSTGVIYLQKKQEEEGIASGGFMTITPNIGHTEGQFKSGYFIEPYKGVAVDFQKSPEEKLPHLIEEEKNELEFEFEKKYITLADIKLPENKFYYSNIYPEADFYLIVNNQIAFYKSTGQKFTLISIKLNQPEEEDFLSLDQLKNAVRLSVDKKDKICIMKNRVVVLMTRDDNKSLRSLVTRIKNNLPNNDPDYLKKVIQFVSVYAVKVDDSINKAEDLIEQLLINESKEQKELDHN